MLDEAVLVAKTRVSEWKSITIEVPSPRDRTVDISADSSMGGEPEHVVQLTVNRTDGALKNIKRFSDNNAGSKLRAWSRFLHTGEEFGLLGQTVAMLSCIGGTMLVWTGISMAIRQAAKGIGGSSEALAAFERSISGSATDALDCSSEYRDRETLNAK
jgi:uncharacterized iron-regulated membrane protein